MSALSAFLEERGLPIYFQALASKLVLDMTVWSPCVTFMFPTSLGLLEGKNIKEIRHKVAMVCSPQVVLHLQCLILSSYRAGSRRGRRPYASLVLPRFSISPLFQPNIVFYSSNLLACAGISSFHGRTIETTRCSLLPP